MSVPLDNSKNIIHHPWRSSVKPQRQFHDPPSDAWHPLDSTKKSPNLIDRLVDNTGLNTSAQLSNEVGIRPVSQLSCSRDTFSADDVAA
jgi:hypothetical protein